MPAGRAAVLGALVVAAFAEQFWAGAVALCVVGSQLRAFSAQRRTHQARAMSWGAAVVLVALGVPLIRMQWPHRLIPELPSLSASLVDEWREVVHLSLGGRALVARRRARFVRDGGHGRGVGSRKTDFARGNVGLVSDSTSGVLRWFTTQ